MHLTKSFLRYHSYFSQPAASNRARESVLWVLGRTIHPNLLIKHSHSPCAVYSVRNRIFGPVLCYCVCLSDNITTAGLHKSSCSFYGTLRKKKSCKMLHNFQGVSESLFQKAPNAATNPSPEELSVHLATLAFQIYAIPTPCPCLSGAPAGWQ